MIFDQEYKEHVERKTLEVIHRYVDTYAVPPTVSELQRELNLSSKSVVAHRLDMLVRDGLATRPFPDAKRPCNIRLTERGYEFLKQ